MKATDWKNAANLIKKRQSQAAMADTSEFSSLPLSELSVDESGPPTVLQGPYKPLSTSTPLHMQQDNKPMTDSVLDESPFQQVIAGILQQSLYPPLAALGTSILKWDKLCICTKLEVVLLKLVVGKSNAIT